MDTPAINGLPPIPGTLRIAKSRDQKERPKRGFEDALNEEDGDDVENFQLSLGALFR